MSVFVIIGVVTAVVTFFCINSSKTGDLEINSNANTSTEINEMQNFNVPNEINMYLNERYTLNPSPVGCSSKVTFSYSGYNKTIIVLDNNVIVPQKIGNTVIIVTLFDNGKIITKPISINIYNNFEFTEMFVNDNKDTQVSKIYYHQEKIFYYLHIHYTSKLIKDVNISYSNNVKDFQNCSNADGCLVYKFYVSGEEEAFFKAELNGVFKYISILCEQIQSLDSIKFKYMFNLPNAFDENYELSNNVLTISSENNDLYIPLSFVIKNGNGDIYTSSYESLIDVKHNIINCDVELINNSIFISTKGKGEIEVILVCKKDNSISDTISIIIL